MTPRSSAFWKSTGFFLGDLSAAEPEHVEGADPG